jgi:uncharacterized membrane protein
MIDTEDPLAELHNALGMKKLNPVWANIEIFLGLAAAAAGLMVAMRVLSSASVEIDWVCIIVSMALMVFGVYLAMAGHRSHLYQSNNKLTAYLAERISKISE